MQRRGLDEAGDAAAHGEVELAGGSGGDLGPNRLADVDLGEDVLFFAYQFADCAAELIADADAGDGGAAQSDVAGQEADVERARRHSGGRRQVELLPLDLGHELTVDEARGIDPN